ncbi:MATE family efflux transporter, partial [Mariniflexile sp. HMF6888]|uniref:MATE family efflux transporter n=1 Tax=Mariniflexile sp. HMF6888 TaxID=3373086 RepID=UPI0037B43822
IRHYKFTIKLKEWKALFNYGIPSFVSEISFSIGLLLINIRLAQLGAVFVSVFGIINYLSFIFLRLFTAAMVSALPIMSFNIGAKLPNRVLGIFKFSLKFTFVLGIVVVTLGLLFPEFLVTIFSGSETEEFKKIASDALGLFFIFFIVAGPNYILGSYLQSIGKLIPSIILNLLKGSVLVAIPLFLLPEYLANGEKWIWLSRTFAEVGAFMLVGFYILNQRRFFFSDKAILK